MSRLLLESSSDTGNDFLQFGVIHAKEVLVILCIKPKFSDQMAEQTMFLSLVQYISHITFSLFFFAKNTFKNKNKNIQPYKKSTAWVTSPSMSSAGQEGHVAEILFIYRGQRLPAIFAVPLNHLHLRPLRNGVSGRNAPRCQPSSQLRALATRGSLVKSKAEH